jgi:hypothetical protein
MINVELSKCYANCKVFLLWTGAGTAKYNDRYYSHGISNLCMHAQYRYDLIFSVGGFVHFHLRK